MFNPDINDKKIDALGSSARISRVVRCKTFTDPNGYLVDESCEFGVDILID